LAKQKEHYQLNPQIIHPLFIMFYLLLLNRPKVTPSIAGQPKVFAQFKSPGKSNRKAIPMRSVKLRHSSSMNWIIKTNQRHAELTPAIFLLIINIFFFINYSYPSAWLNKI
jgi:hypothetical protein